MKLALLANKKHFQMKAIHFQIDNTTALSYLVKMAGNQKQVFNRISKVNLEVSPAPWDYNYCRISSKLHEHGGRLAFKKLKRQFRVETLSTSISENFSDQRKTRDRPFCFSTVSTTSTVQYMETRSIQSGNYAMQQIWSNQYLYASHLVQ